MRLISIIIPTLNEATTICTAAAALARLHLRSGMGVEIIVADGGSADDTMRLARSCDLNVIDAPRGRGQQMNAGADEAEGDVLLFLHADTRLPDDALLRVDDILKDERVGGGNFSLAFDGQTWESRALTRIYPFLRLGGMCYGDSAIFIRRSLFEALGGYCDYPIFEDCDLYRRLKRAAKFARLPQRAVTSARRFEGRFIRTFALWSVMQCLYWLGVDPQRLNRLYKPLR